MKLRSLLFVPADSDRKFAKADACGADALILDLEDSVAPGRKKRTALPTPLSSMRQNGRGKSTSTIGRSTLPVMALPESSRFVDSLRSR